MRNYRPILFLLCAALTLCACSRRVQKELLEIEQFVEAYPDSALGRLSALDSASCSRRRPAASGYYDFETNQLILHFNRNLGVCTIEITSTAGEHQVHAFDTSVGSFVTNLSGTPGTYILSIQNETGFETSTYFLIP